MLLCILFFFFFFFNDTATTEIYTLSLHDALPISCLRRFRRTIGCRPCAPAVASYPSRSEEHTSELQSRLHLVCRLLLEKKKTTLYITRSHINRLHHAQNVRTCARTNQLLSARTPI